MNPKRFFAELKRRNVYRAAVLYGMSAWLLAQITTQIFPFFNVPNSAVRFVIIALLLVIALLVYQRLPFRTENVEAIPDKSIAVLPFANFSEEKANAFFADGVQDDILTSLAEIKELR